MKNTGIERVSGAIEDKSAQRCVFTALILTCCVMLPLLAAPVLYSSDDWAYGWIFHNQGGIGVIRYMLHAGHPGLGFFLSLLWDLGGKNPALWSHIIAIVFHLANGWLLWLIFQKIPNGRKFAAILATLYLVSPFVAGFDFGLSATLFDMVIFCYLLSIWLSGYGNVFLMLCAVLAALVGLSLETLAALEPIRWWYLNRQYPNIRAVIWRALPFACAALLISIARIVWFQPEGAYFGYNAIKAVDFGEQLHLAQQHLSFFFGAIDSLWYASALVRYDSLLALIPVAGAVAVFVTLARAGPMPRYPELALLVALGVLVLLMGMLPYNLIGSVPQRIDNVARFAIVSQFGALILFSVIISLVPSVSLQAMATAMLVFIFACVPLQMTKWLLYEELVLREFRTQVGAYLAESAKQVLVVQFLPPSSHFLYRHRGCLSSYDINVALEVSGLRQGSYVFDRDCGATYYNSTYCGFWFGFFIQPCPTTRLSGQFRLNPGADNYEKSRLIDLATMVQLKDRWGIGELTIDNSTDSTSELSRDSLH